MRTIRQDVVDTLLAVRTFDGTNKHKDARRAHEISEYPVSGDALALITEKEPK